MFLNCVYKNRRCNAAIMRKLIKVWLLFMGYVTIMCSMFRCVSSLKCPIIDQWNDACLIAIIWKILLSRITLFKMWYISRPKLCYLPLTVCRFFYTYIAFNGWHLRCRTMLVPLQWCHNGRDGVWNSQPRDCLLYRLCRHRSKKTSKLRVAGLCGDRWIPRTNGQ